MAADEGFEPSQTESESGVLPLHYSAVSLKRPNVIRAEPRILSSVFFKFLKKNSAQKYRFLLEIPAIV